MQASLYVFRTHTGAWRAGFSILPEVDRRWLLNSSWRADACRAAGEEVTAAAEVVLAVQEMLPLGIAAAAVRIWERNESADSA